MNEENARKIAYEILDMFEELLEQCDISIPSEDREGAVEEARLFGSEYYNLEDKIIELLVSKEQ